MMYALSTTARAPEVGFHFDFSAIQHTYDQAARVFQYNMQAKPRPNFSVQLLEEIKRLQAGIQAYMDSRPDTPVRYLVLGSSAPGIFNLGGDLTMFAAAIRRQDRKRLTDYATLCIDVLYTNHRRLERGITTIALVAGDALGGGFEAALSHDFIVAERGVKMGFPEAVFNVFPGMGAYSFLSRRIAPALTERMITSGDLYRAEDLYEMGVVDVLAEPGAGKAALSSFLRKHEKRSVTHEAVWALRNMRFPISYQELHEIAMHWVEAALSIPEHDVRMMERLVAAQNKRLVRVVGR